MVHKMQRLALSSGQRPSQAAAEAGLLPEAKEEGEQVTAPTGSNPEPVDSAKCTDGATCGTGDGVESQGKMEVDVQEN